MYFVEFPDGRKTHFQLAPLSLGLAAYMLLSPMITGAVVYEIFPPATSGSCNEEFENRANSLVPGDELIVHGGIYAQTCRRAITVNGTASQPITIRAAAGEIPLLTNDASQNNVDIVNSSYLVIKGLHFQGASQGIRFEGTNHHVTVEDSEVFNTDNNAIALNSGNADSMVFRRNHIHHTGQSTGSTEGEGFYVGCHTGSCRVTNSLFEGNYIHHLRSTSSGGNDGIEVKFGSSGNIVRHNVIHDTNIGTVYPCLTLYGGGAASNIIEGNVLWNCGEGIYAIADAVIRNNIILQSDSGISSYPHAASPQVKNLTIVNNTLYGHQTCLYLRWSGATNMILANNAFYCGNQAALDGTGLTNPLFQIRANFVQGSLSGGAVDGSQFLAGGTATTAFVDAANKDLWPKPGSPLIGSGLVSFAPASDFNGTLTRQSPFDVGAYETEGLPTNPGWRITAGFKPTGSGDLTPPAAPQNLRIL